MVVVKGTQTDHFPAFLLQADMLTYNVNNIVGLLNFQNNTTIKHPCHIKPFPIKKSDMLLCLRELRTMRTPLLSTYVEMAIQLLKYTHNLKKVKSPGKNPLLILKNAIDKQSDT
jgi:hypothetical protein